MLVQICEYMKGRGEVTKTERYNAHVLREVRKRGSMKNIRLNLKLFGESGEGCAAEQSFTAENTSLDETAGDNTETSVTAEGAVGDADRIKQIGALFGIDGGDAEAVLSHLTQRQARVTLMQMLRAKKAEKVYMELKSEADRLSSKIEGFDLMKELSDRRFSAMISAGFTLEEAWRAGHAEELMEKAVETAKNEAVAVALEKLRRSNLRPSENGMDGKAPQSSKGSVEGLTGRGIRDILKRVENGAKIKF